MKYLKSAILEAQQLKLKGKDGSHTLSEDDIILNAALNKANANVAESTEYDKFVSDKGMFGGKKMTFKSDVYKKPTDGDISSRSGLITTADLHNHVGFRKGDTITFQWVRGEAGASTYSAKSNGQDATSDEIKWTDKLIRELVDEGALQED